MATIRKRTMSTKERRYVEKELADEESRIVNPGNAARSFAQNLRRGGFGALILMAMIAGALGEFADVNLFATSSQAWLALVAGAVIFAVLSATVMTFLFFKSPISEYDPEDAEDARKALASGEILDEVHEIREAKQFVMHGEEGLAYFLHTADDRVFYWVDEESEDLWCDDKSIFESSAKPLERLIIRETAVGDIWFDIKFEGAPVPVKSRIPMKKGVDEDLEEDEFIDEVSWAEVERRCAA